VDEITNSQRVKVNRKIDIGGERERERVRERERERMRGGYFGRKTCERKGGYYSRMKKERRMAREDAIRQLEER